MPLVSPGVFGGPVVFASGIAPREGDPSVDVRLAAFSGFAAPRLIASASSVPEEIVRNGWNWGKLHAHNAVDIAAPCGTPIFSFAEGIVSKVGSPLNWNEGYGGFIEIAHRTSDGYEYSAKYAHTKRNEYAVGRYVMPGDKIALVGDTGNVHGPTGCHVHFEVRGAKNPFVR